jgi:hypothetical protein
VRQLLGEDAQTTLSLEQKYQILTAYMNGGGIKGLLQDEEEGAGGEIDPEEEKMIEDEFMQIYTLDEKLREVLGADPS